MSAVSPSAELISDLQKVLSLQKAGQMKEAEAIYKKSNKTGALFPDVLVLVTIFNAMYQFFVLKG